MEINLTCQFYNEILSMINVVRICQIGWYMNYKLAYICEFYNLITVDAFQVNAEGSDDEEEGGPKRSTRGRKSDSPVVSMLYVVLLQKRF